MTAQVDVVTGAFSNSGRTIAERLLDRGREVRTITGHPERVSDFGGRVAATPYDFAHPERMAEGMKGARVLYNNYWVRFDHGGKTYEKAVEDTRALVSAAKQAGVEKIVQVSIANASADSRFRYYKGKAAIEEIVRKSGLRFAILKPTVLFGGDDVLINNIAWFLRNFSLFLIPGDGTYHIQPIHVRDLAELAVAEGEREESRELDAVGPEDMTYNRLVSLVAEAVESSAKVFHAPAAVAWLASKMLGMITGDVVLTRAEVDGLMADLLHSKAAPTGRIRFSDWLAANKRELGENYLSELRLHFDKENVHA